MGEDAAGNAVQGRLSLKEAEMSDTTKGIIQLNDLAKQFACLKQAAIQPKTVTSKEQADRMTGQDPVGYVWTVGEKYYEVGGRHG